MKDCQKNKNSSRQFLVKILIMSYMLIVITMYLTPAAFAREGILVIHTSQEKSKMVAQAISDSVDGKLLEIKDLKNHTGFFGYLSTKFDDWFNRDTSIEPLHPDLTSCSLVIIVSAVNKWKMEIPIRTMMNENSLEDKMLFIVTTSDLDIKRYDSYDDSASYWNRRARNKVRKWREKSWEVSKKSGAKILGHVHIATNDKKDDDVQKIAANIFNFHAENAPSWLFKADDLPTWILTNTDFN